MTNPTFKLDREPAGDWIHEGACIGVDPELFFPGRTESGNRAKAVCGACPVMDQCRAYGMGEKFGIWGGLSQRDRDRIRRKRRQMRSVA